MIELICGINKMQTSEVENRIVVFKVCEVYGSKRKTVISGVSLIYNEKISSGVLFAISKLKFLIQNAL